VGVLHLDHETARYDWTRHNSVVGYEEERGASDWSGCHQKVGFCLYKWFLDIRKTEERAMENRVEKKISTKMSQ
jgi:hypothetical protein